MNSNIPLFVSLVLVSIVIAAAYATLPAQDKDQPVIRTIVHVNFEDPDRQEHGLKNLTNILNGAPGSTIVVVCHGGGIKLLVDGESSHSEKVAELVGKGVQFLACENTLEDKSISKAKLLPGVNTVPSGAIEVIRRQQEGFGYFKP